MAGGILRESLMEVQGMLGMGWSVICTIRLKTG
jgi:hypothetical protein